MIGHDAFRRLAAEAIDQPRGREEDPQLGIHRAGCDACRAFDHDIRADAIAIGNRRELLPSSSLDRRIEAALYGARPRGQLSPAAVLLILAIMLVAAASAVIVAGSFLNREQVRLPERPAVPDGWRSSLASSRDLRIAVPPYLVVSDVDGTVMANEPPAGNANFLSLMAAGPASAAQPRAGQSLESWLLASFLDKAPHGPIQTRTISLPAGRGVELRVVALAGTPDVTQIALYGISTGDGAAFLWLTGRPEDFVKHAADLQLIPQLVETGPALTAILPPEPPGFELQLSTPAGWHQMAAPVQTADGPDWTTFVSNTQFPNDLCETISDGTLSCSPVMSNVVAGTFVLGVIEIRGGIPRSPIDSPSLPPATRHATVAGHSAIRTDDLAAIEGTLGFTWEVPSPGEPSGTFVIRMVAAPDGYEALMPQVELMLQNAVFVARE